MLDPKLVKLFIKEDMSSARFLQNMYTPSNYPSKPGGLRIFRMITVEGEVDINILDLYEYHNNKEFYNSKLYKHLVGYDDEET